LYGNFHGQYYHGSNARQKVTTMTTKHAPKFEWTFSGFIIGMLLSSVIVVSLTLFAYDVQDAGGLSGNIGLNSFNKSADLIRNVSALAVPLKLALAVL